MPYLIGKNGTRWQKHRTERLNVRSIAENIVIHLLRTKGNIHKARKASEI